MSADISRAVRGLLALTVCVWPGFSMCQDASKDGSADEAAALASNHGQTPVVSSPEFPYLIVDPLKSRPHILETGAALPGDAAPTVCPASIDSSRPFSLVDAVDVALCSNPQVQEAWALVKQQAAAVGEARAAWLPTANATFSQLSNRTTYPGVPLANSQSSGHTVYGTLTWRIVDFGARAAGNEAAGRSLSAALASHDAALQKALSSVIQAYFDALTDKAGVDAHHEATQLAQMTLDATKRREDAGASSLGDTLQARAALAKARLAEQRAIGDYNKALSVLVYSAGLPIGSRLTLASDNENPPATAVADLQKWIDEAAAAHPAIAAARAQLEAAEANVVVVKAQGMPTLDFNGNYYQNGYPNQGLQPTRSSTTSFGLVLTIPLFDGFTRTYQARRAQAQVEQSRAQLEGTRRETLTNVVKDHSDAMAALANLGSSLDWISAALDSEASAQRRYAGGAGDVLELLTAQAAVDDAKLERVRCLSEWRAARLRLLADAGRLGHGELASEAGR